MNEHIYAAINELYELGIQDVVISPGSRSTPLSILLCEHKFKIYVNIDERSAGFFALGIAKEKNKPVILVCTSGSAAAHYFPAIIEAKYSRIPLIILTADRPPELRNVGAPQTINQNKFFGDFVNHYEELSILENNINRYPRLVMQKAYMKSMETPKGPVQINVPLREPLISDINLLDCEKNHLEKSFEFLSGEIQIKFDDSIFKEKRIVIICGGDLDANYHKEIIDLGKRLKAPVLADPLSNIRNYKSEVIIDSYDGFLKDSFVKEELEPEYIILFGQAPVSKRLQQFITYYKDAICLQVDKGVEYRNPSLTTNKYIQCSPKAFIEEIKILNDNNNYLHMWEEKQITMRSKINQVFEEKKIFEGKVVSLLQNIIPQSSRLVVANSMAIRNIDYFWEAKNQNIKILCNRGANGIDGTISTALGVSTSNYPTILLTGDLAFFHDINGLLIGKTHNLNLIIILINNNGGGIFHHLPQKGEKYFEYLFCTPHGIDFKGIKTLYNINHYIIKDYDDFQITFKKSMEIKGINILEFKTDMEESYRLYEKYTKM